MLKTLFQLAHQEKLVADLSYEMKPVAWTIPLDPEGTLLPGGFLSNKELAPPEYTAKGKEKKRKEITRRLLVPRQFVIETGAGRTSGAYAYFFVDKAAYVFGHSPGSAPHQPQTDKKLCIQHQLFIDNVAACYSSTHSPTAKAILLFLERVKKEGLPIALPDSVASNDQFAFIVKPEIEDYAHEDPAIMEYWERISNPAPPKDAITKTCLVTGENFIHSALFPSIKRVPGGTTSGAGLVSFNSKVFESYGWEGAENATISPKASQYIATALNRLMDPAFETQAGKKLSKRYESIAKDTVIAYWPKGLLADALDKHDGSFSNLLASSWKGLKPDPDDASPFHAFTLSGAQGRIIVRDHFETTAKQIYENLSFHYESLQIVALTKPAKGKPDPPLYGTTLLLSSSVLDGKMENISPPIATQFHAAIHKGRDYLFPINLILKALARSRAEIHDDSWKSSYRTDIRAALLKAYLIRNHKFKITKAMNPEEKKTAYLLGRLLSCYGEMQRLANLPRTVNADLISKHYGKFMVRPSHSYSMLSASYIKHSRTALKNNASKASGLAKRLISEIEAITRFLEISKIPSHLSTQEQALFTLGFHHQNHWHKQSKSDRLNWLLELKIEDPYSPLLLIAPLTKPESNTTK